jgi:hypothetical protein
LARYNHCAAALAPGGMFVCGGVVGAANDMPVRGQELTMWWDAEQQGWTDVCVSQRCHGELTFTQCDFASRCCRYTGGKLFHPELSFATLTGIVDTVDMAHTGLYCPPQLSDAHLLRVPEHSLFDWTLSLPTTAVLVGGKRPPHLTSDEVMQVL